MEKAILKQSSHLDRSPETLSGIRFTDGQFISILDLGQRLAEIKFRLEKHLSKK